MIKISKPQSNFKIDKLLHPTQKPYNLFERIILENSNEGGVVLDPFCGPGVTGIVCKRNKRNFICIDIDEKYCKMAIEGISKVDGTN